MVAPESGSGTAARRGWRRQPHRLRRELPAPRPVLAANTVRNRDDDYRHRIAPTLGDLALGQVTRERVEAWLAELVANARSRGMVVRPSPPCG